ncbi:MAG: excinuclease ABC subunit UvrB [Candidatus Stahlbacteria bacterium]|nr:excinuclease ABC subunit UvrB [Candidatus Stahlbacteria bacterium]
MEFKLVSQFKPTGDQPKAIKELVAGIRREVRPQGDKFQTLLGVTGSGKTFTIANVIQEIQKPTLIISHNKTLAAQLYGEFKGFFPHNAVEYFISYYDYYQPEAYLPVTDTYIEKDASINAEIGRMRLNAASALIERQDVIIVASVSCIYGLGSPEEFKKYVVSIREGVELARDDLINRLINIHYVRNDIEFEYSTFRVKGDVVEIYLSNEDIGIRIEFLGDKVDKIFKIHPVTMEVIETLPSVHIYPAKHFVFSQPTLDKAIIGIEKELAEQLQYFRSHGKLLEAQRLESRTHYDIELMREIGYCSGVENYSRWLSGRQPGSRPSCLIDYFPKDYLMVIDESHVSIPQLNGMYNGDRMRKSVLIEYGFRLPSALDNRPLMFNEFLALVNQAIFTSATPADFETTHSTQIVEQVIRPTGLIDPKIIVKPTLGQIDDLISCIKERATQHERVLVTTLTKHMAEELANYLTKEGIKVRWLHSDLNAIERVDILRGLRLEDFDCLVGINLLREGLDLPEVSLVAILDADREGFLRSFTSLIQITGRTARNVHSEVIMYADNITTSMEKAINETNRRRDLQIEYNTLHNIIPTTIYKTREEILSSTIVAHKTNKIDEPNEINDKYLSKIDKLELIRRLDKEMKLLARGLKFEAAAKIRDRLRELKNDVKEDSEVSVAGGYRKGRYHHNSSYSKYTKR